MVADKSSDRIYRLDRDVESVLVTEIAGWPEKCFPLTLIGEGLGETGVVYFASSETEPQVGDAASATRGDVSEPSGWRVIVDPIDGTRQLMYDKRPAWFLAAVAPDRGWQTVLSDAVASALIELPVSRQSQADVFLAERGSPTVGRRLFCGVAGTSAGQAQSSEPLDRDTQSSETVSVEERLHESVPVAVRPSGARDVQDGFLTVVSCFPGTRRLAADLSERIADQLGSGSSLPPFFDDQYISTGGQMVQLMTGRDRACIDLRPVFNDLMDRTGNDRFIEVHPYDAAGLLAARQAGVILTDARGEPLDAPLDVTTGLNWCGYANQHIQSLVQPIVMQWLYDHGVR